MESVKKRIPNVFDTYAHVTPTCEFWYKRQLKGAAQARKIGESGQNQAVRKDPTRGEKPSVK